jgi:flavin reductase (DIM6/NTAB) family NADH-FMN oxidoreductase RutF
LFPNLEFARGKPAPEAQRGADLADTLAPDMGDTIDQALSTLGGGVFILTAAHDDQRHGMRVLSVQQCSLEPRLISVATRKGHPIEPLIRDSHAFAICKIDPSQKLVLRKFLTEAGPEFEDPFDSFVVESMRTGSPILSRCVAAFDCEVVRHFDLEADHEIFIGQIVEARVTPLL